MNLRFYKILLLYLQELPVVSKHFLKSHQFHFIQLYHFDQTLKLPLFPEVGLNEDFLQLIHVWRFQIHKFWNQFSVGFLLNNFFWEKVFVFCFLFPFGENFFDGLHALLICFQLIYERNIKLHGDFFKQFYNFLIKVLIEKLEPKNRRGGFQHIKCMIIWTKNVPLRIVVLLQTHSFKKVEHPIFDFSITLKEELYIIHGIWGGLTANGVKKVQFASVRRQKGNIEV